VSFEESPHDDGHGMAGVVDVVGHPGLAISYGPDLPAGATIIVLTGAAYLATTLLHGPLSAIRRRGTPHAQSL